MEKGASEGREAVFEDGVVAVMLFLGIGLSGGIGIGGMLSMSEAFKDDLAARAVTEIGTDPDEAFDRSTLSIVCSDFGTRPVTFRDVFF